MTRVIEVVEYKDEWRRLYEDEANRLRPVFGSGLMAVHHIGSTSVPGMQAKPIIDILVELEETVDITAYFGQMEALGYHCRGECLDAVVPGTPGRFYFSKDVYGQRYSQVHACRVGHFQIAELLALRDFLRAHSPEAAAYGALKRELARRVRHDNVAYMRSKDGFIKKLIHRATKWKRAQPDSGDGAGLRSVRF